jgi:hypothetical protein
LMADRDTAKRTTSPEFVPRTTNEFICGSNQSCRSSKSACKEPISRGAGAEVSDRFMPAYSRFRLGVLFFPSESSIRGGATRPWSGNSRRGALDWTSARAATSDLLSHIRSPHCTAVSGPPVASVSGWRLLRRGAGRGLARFANWTHPQRHPGDHHHEGAPVAGWGAQGASRRLHQCRTRRSSLPRARPSTMSTTSTSRVRA